MPPTSRAWRTLVFDEILDAVLIADDERRFIDANAAACALFGTALGDLLGRRVEEFADPSSDFDPSPRGIGSSHAGTTPASSRCGGRTARG